jgi:hypothetical protein
MNEEAILELYNELSTDYEVGDIDQFKAYLQDPESRVDFFEQIIKPIYAVEDIADFEAFYGLKKKDDTAFGLEDGSSELTPLSRNQQLGVTPAVEKDTAIERMFGKNEVTDFFGDLYRSGVQGYAQGATVDDALNLFAKGQDISDEDLKEYIESVRKMESFGPSEEMQDFTKIYEKNGKGLWGFLSGVAQNPTVIPQLFTSSVSAMLNKGSIAAGAAGAATGGIGAGLATGGVAAIPGALIGGIGGVSGALETGLSYTEFLKEELDKEGLSFDEDNVKKILLNEEAMNSIKNKALARGLTIAAIDAFSGGLATSITRKTATKLGSKLAGATAGGTAEALGGATGEAAARLVTGQEMDIAEIGFEGVAGTATAPLTIGAGLMKPPSYSMNGGKASRKDIQTLLSTGTPEQIAAVKISVKNDSDLYKEAETKKSDIILLAEIESANPGIIEEDKSKLLVLEKARQTLANSNIKSAKNNLKIIDKQIDDISKKYLPIEQEVLTKEEKDAVQESSTETPPVSDQPGVGEEVGKRDTAGEITGEVAPQEETVPPADQEITEEADVTEVVKEKDGVTTTNFEKIIKGRKRSNSLAPISVLDNYELDLEANNIEGMDIVGVREIRKKDGVTAATIMVREGDGQFEAEVVLQDKVKEEADVTELTEDEKLEKVTKEKVKKLVTAPRRITEPFIVPTKKNRPSNTQINFTEDGKIESVVNKETREPVSDKTRKVAEKLYLESLIDVNDGKFTEYQEGVTEERANQFVAENSQNVREIAEAIESEKNSIVNQRLEFDEADVLYDIDGYFTIEDIAEVWDERLVNENSKSGRNIRRYWTRPALDKFGRPTLGISKIDTKAQELGISVEALKEIIIDYPTRNINRPEEFSRAVAKVGKTDALIDLENKFEKLTGLKATDTNINTVLDIDPNRPPLTEEKKLSLIEREQAIAESEGERVVKGKKVSAKQVVEGKPKEVTVEEIKALKDQIRLEARAAREAKGDQTARRKAISNAISSLQTVGKINIAKAKSLINKISTVDLNKAIQVEKALAYVEKVFTKADYDAKLSEAESLRKSIKKLSKTEKLEVNSLEAAKRFSEIDPVLVEDIESYIEEAKKVKDGVTPSTKTKTMPALDIKKTDEYTASEVNKQKKIKLEAEKEVFQELTGLSPDELSLQDMREIVYGVEQDQPSDVREKELESKAKAKADVIKKGLNKAFNTVSTIVNQLIESETDPFTGEIIELTKEQKKLVKDFLNIDINKMSDADAVIALDSLINFATNKTTGGMGTIVKRNEGNLNSGIAKSMKLIAKPLAALSKKDPGISKAWNKYIASLPFMLENMFKGQSKALLFEKLSGLKELVNGIAESESYAKKITDQYYNKFIKLPFSEAVFGETKTNPNGEVFNSAFNDIERGMFAFMRRSVPGQEQVEFDRRKSLIEQSIESLSNQGGVDAKKAELYNEVYEKILKDANNPSEVEANVDKVNVEAVEWMTDVWAENYKALGEVNLNIYNKILDKDTNYTPDSFIRLEDLDMIGEIGEPIFDFGSKKISDKKSGVLMDVQRPTNLPKGRVINLGFDGQNISSLERARIDINTAAAIQKVKGFFESSNFKDIVPNTDDRKLLSDRVRDYVEAKRGREYISKNAQKFLKAINLYSGYAVSRTLGGVTQIFKQTIPVLVNTMINAGVENIGIIGELVSNTSLAKFLENSGYPIVNRGLQSSTTLESNNTKIENSAKGGLNKLARRIRDVQGFWLQKFLVNPDRYIAQASWMMYYMKSLNEQGVDTSYIDWENHEVNTKAGDYAQQQVDRQQNITDTDLQGKIFTSKNPAMQFARKVLLPFSNFLLNQKTRMYSDVTTLFSKTSDTQDKNAAGRSLTGLVAETIVFNSLGLILTQALSAMSAESEDDKKAKEKRLSNRIKGRAGQAIKDVLSPLPFPQFDGPLISGINALIAAASESDDPYQFFELQPEDAWERLGLFSIPGERFAEWNQMRKMAFTGEYEQKLPFGKTVTRKLKRKGRDEMLANWISYTLYSAGLAPSEVGTVARYNMKQIMKKKTKK